MSHPTSRQRFQDYLAEVAERRRGTKDSQAQTSGESGRQRSFLQLLGQFWAQLEGHRGKVVFALATLTVSTLLALIPPAGTKFAIDYVLTEPPLPLPTWLSVYLPETSRMGLLWLIAGFVTVIAVTRTVVHLWGRWYATKAVNLVQADIRRRVFEHSLSLPLHRVQELKILQH